MSTAVSACPCCGSGLPPKLRTHLRLAEALEVLPCSEATAYDKRRQKTPPAQRWPWLTHVGPGGHLTNELWVNVVEAVAWWIACGQPVVARRLLAIATFTK